MTTQQKMYELDFNATTLSLKVARAKQMSEDLCEYFEYNVENEESREYALYDFEKNRIYSQILFDYMEEIAHISDELITLVDLLKQSEVQEHVKNY